MKSVLIVAVFALFSCVHDPETEHTEEHSHIKQTDALENSVQIGDNLDTFHYKDIYFSKQPSVADFAKLKEQGFAHIINFRETSEHDVAAEKKQVESLGMVYTHLPFPKEKLSKEFIDKVTGNVVKHRKEGKTLIHCSTGNRVALWVGGHFYRDHNYSKEKSLTTAKENGLNNPEAISKLEKFLDGVDKK